MQILMDFNISIFPDPARDFINIDVGNLPADQRNLQYSIMDFQGRSNPQWKYLDPNETRIPIVLPDGISN